MQANNTTLKNVGVIKEGQTDVTCTQMSVKYKVLDHNLRFRWTSKCILLILLI